MAVVKNIIWSFYQSFFLKSVNSHFFLFFFGGAKTVQKIVQKRSFTAYHKISLYKIFEFSEIFAIFRRLSFWDLFLAFNELIRDTTAKKN